MPVRILFYLPGFARLMQVSMQRSGFLHQITPLIISSLKLFCRTANKHICTMFFTSETSGSITFSIGICHLNLPPPGKTAKQRCRVAKHLVSGNRFPVFTCRSAKSACKLTKFTCRSAKFTCRGVNSACKLARFTYRGDKFTYLGYVSAYKLTRFTYRDDKFTYRGDVSVYKLTKFTYRGVVSVYKLTRFAYRIVRLHVGSPVDTLFVSCSKVIALRILE